MLTCLSGESVKRVRHAVSPFHQSLIYAAVILGLDVVIEGCFEISLLLCPIWFIVSLVKAVMQQPGPRVGFIRILFPLAVVLLAFGNYYVQTGIARHNSQRIIVACERYRAVKGNYPQRLEDLVPEYVPSVPRAKYCLFQGEFQYWGELQLLVWYDIPPYGRRTYNFGRGTWHYID